MTNQNAHAEPNPSNAQNGRDAVGFTSRDSGRKTYVQVRTVVDHMKKQDRRLQRLYEQEANAAEGLGRDRERAGLLYRYAARREQGFARYLDRQTDREKERILDTWLQYGDVSTTYDERVDAMLAAPPNQPGDVQARLTELDRQLAAVYRQLETRAEVPEVASFFRRLREASEQRIVEHAEQLQKVDDL